jgi:hypothetical protein
LALNDFEHRPTWRRDSALVAALAVQIPLTSQQVDDLFRLAETNAD